jgi:hypothetical protein
MGFQELLPGRPLLPVRSRFNAMLLEDGGDGPAPDLVAQIRERALNPRIAPVAILRRHADNQLPNLGHHRRPARPAAAVAVVFPGDELPMPCQEGIRAHDGSDLLEHSPPQVLRFGGQANALIVGEAQSARSELLAEHAVLRLEIIDHLALLLVDSARATTRSRSGCDSGGMTGKAADQTQNRLTIELLDTTGARFLLAVPAAAAQKVCDRWCAFVSKNIGCRGVMTTDVVSCLVSGPRCRGNDRRSRGLREQ